MPADPNRPPADAEVSSHGLAGLNTASLPSASDWSAGQRIAKSGPTRRAMSSSVA